MRAARCPRCGSPELREVEARGDARSYYVACVDCEWCGPTIHDTDDPARAWHPSSGEHATGSGPYDWQAEEDLAAWWTEIQAAPSVYLPGDIVSAVRMLAAETKRSLPKEAHD